MAFEGSSYKKRIGTDLFTVVAINPTADELRVIKKLGDDKDVKEPVYKKDNGSFNVVLWLRGQNTGLHPLYFTMSSATAGKKDGTKTQYIDKFGRTAFAASPLDFDTYKYFDGASARKAIVGEADLTSFVKMWLGIGKDQEARLDKPLDIASGNLSELVGYLKKFSSKQVCGLVYLDDAGYTKLWNRAFGYPKSLGNEEIWGKKIEDAEKNEYTKLKAKKYSIRLIEVEDEKVEMDEDKPQIASADDLMGGISQEEVGDGLPF